MYKKGDLVTIGPDHESGLFIIVGQETDTLAGPLWVCAPLHPAAGHRRIEMAEQWLKMESSIE